MNIILPMSQEVDIEYNMKKEFDDQKEAEEQKARLIAQAKKEREEALAKKAALPPVKYYYDVKVECMLPATITYRILAENAEQAAEMIKGKSPNSVQHKLVGRKELILKVYDSGSSMMRFMKRLLG